MLSLNEFMSNMNVRWVLWASLQLMHINSRQLMQNDVIVSLLLLGSSLLLLLELQMHLILRATILSEVTSFFFLMKAIQSAFLLLNEYMFFLSLILKEAFLHQSHLEVFFYDIEED